MAVPAVMRLVWTSCAAGAVVLIVAGTPAAYRAFRTPCAGGFPACADVQLSPDGQVLLDTIGLSVGGYAALALTAHLATAAVTLVLAALLVWRRPTDLFAVTAAWTWLALSVTVATGPDVLARDHEQVAAVVAVAWFVQGAALVPLLCLFPDGRFVPPFTRWVALAAVLYHLWVVGRPWLPLPEQDWQVLDGIVHLGEFAVVIAVQVFRYRVTSDAVQRQQTRWAVYGLGVLASIMTTAGLAGLLAGTPTRPGTPGHGLLATTAVVGILLSSTAFAVAILRFRLFELDVVVNRTLVYGFLTMGIIAVYTVVVLVYSRAVGGRGPVASGVAAIVVAIAVEPLRSRLQQTVNRLMYGDRSDPYHVLRTLGQQLQAAPVRSEVAPAIVAAIQRSLRLPYAGIVLHDMPDTAAAAATPPDAIRIPLTHQGTAVGLLTVSPRTGERTLTGRDLRLLSDLAAQAGPALHAATLAHRLEEAARHLQQSRERVIHAAAEERRRLRRDLHDDLASALAGMALAAGGLGALVDSDPRSARLLADDLRDGLRTAGETIRHLAYGLRPPALDERGLVGALRARAAQLGATGVPAIVLDVDEPLPALPAAVEVAAYRIAQEALTNVFRHAGASRCVVRLRVTSHLHLDIIDDGAGIAASSVPGIGLHSMRERAEELGGCLDVRTADDGGTHVAVTLPLAPAVDPSSPPGTSVP